MSNYVQNQPVGGLQQEEKKEGSQKPELYAETKDPFVNKIFKILRNKNKKLEKIKETETKVKRKELQPNKEQLDMINSKDKILQEMEQQKAILQMYQEAYPDLPVWSQISGKKGGKAKKPQEKSEQIHAQVSPAQVEQQPQIDINKVNEDTLRLVAQAIIVSQYQVSLKRPVVEGSNHRVDEALRFILEASNGLNPTSFRAFDQNQATSRFVEVFSSLVSRSLTQVGSSSRETYADIHQVVVKAFDKLGEHAVVEEEAKTQSLHQSHHHEDLLQQKDYKEELYKEEQEEDKQEYNEEVGEEENYGDEVKEEETPDVEKQTEAQLEQEQEEFEEQPREAGRGRGRGRGDRGEERGRGRGGRGGRGYRGGYGDDFHSTRKQNVDADGFTVVKDKHEEQQHWVNRGERHGRGGHRGGYRGTRGRGEGRGEGRGGRGRGEGRGGRGRGDRPHTHEEHEERKKHHFNTGEVRKDQE